MRDKFTCFKYSFIRFQGLSGFNAFNDDGKSVGIDEVCKEIDKLKQENEKLKSAIVEIRKIMDVKTYNNLDLAIDKILKEIEQ